MEQTNVVTKESGWTTDQCERGDHDFVDCVLGDGRACSNCDAPEPGKYECHNCGCDDHPSSECPNYSNSQAIS